MLYLKGFIIRFFMGLTFLASLQPSIDNSAKATKEENANIQPNTMHYNKPLQKELFLLSTGQFNENPKSCSTTDSNCSTQKE